MFSYLCFSFGLVCAFFFIMQHFAFRKFIKYYDLYNELKNFRKIKRMWGLWL